MQRALEFFIDGAWRKPHSSRTVAVINPASEEAICEVALGDETDADQAVRAARAAFDSFARTTKKERIELLEAVIAQYDRRHEELVEVVQAEVGAPRSLSAGAQVPSGIEHFRETLRVFREENLEESMGATRILKEPVGVCALITPWNWPLNQIACKVAPALAAGCTMVLKPSEVAPLNAVLFAEILEAAGVPRGVFNLVNGDGATVGTALSSHPEVDMVSFTGSTRAGIEVARNAAPGVKRVAQELGGKSANILLDDVDFETAVTRDTVGMCSNTGQSCNAATRMLVPHERMDEVAAIARRAAESIVVGDPADEATTIGPLVSDVQFGRVQALIEAGIAEGAKLQTGGPGRPEGFARGYYVRPTVFSHATNEMRIAREEIFGPVLTIIGFSDDEDALRIANDTPYGLSGYISSGDPERALALARRFRSGNVHVNGGELGYDAPFGGYGQSGNGREAGVYGLQEFFETKAIVGV